LAEERRVLPYLTREERKERDRLEDILDRDLSACLYGDRIDEEKALHILHDAAVSIFDLEFNAYSNKPGYEPKWLPDIVYESVYRVLKAAENIYWRDLVSLFKELDKTVTQHVKRIPQKVFIRAPEQGSPQVFAGVDLSTASPLLKMAAIAALTPPPSLNARQAFVNPLLLEKGWSILDWATNSDVAYHTAADYLAGLKNPYPSTRLKLARSLGIVIQQLPK
jgi:hypothetical protein